VHRPQPGGGALLGAGLEIRRGIGFGLGSGVGFGVGLGRGSLGGGLAARRALLNLWRGAG